MRLLKYKIETKKCPICSSLFQTKIGHPKEKTCCSYSCANRHFRPKRTDEEKIKISSALSVMHLKTCLNCGNTFTTKVKRQKFCGRVCKGKFLWRDVAFKAKMVNLVKERVKNGTHNGWKKRSTATPSYPEKFFMGVFDSRNIKYEFDYPVSKWWIDFAFLEKKIALEIDGRQHERPERKKKDEEKDAFLKSVGWKIHRIKWKSINSEWGKAYIQSEIEKFMKVYQCVV